MNTPHETNQTAADAALESLLRAARPEEPTPLADERAREIFARAIALSGVASAADGLTPHPAAEPARPWWLPRFPQLSRVAWGAAVCAASLAAVAAVATLRPERTVVPASPSIALVDPGDVTRPASTPAMYVAKPAAPGSPSPAGDAARGGVEEGAKPDSSHPQQRNKPRSLRRSRRMPAPSVERVAPDVTPRFGRTPDTLVAWKDASKTAAPEPDLLVVASGAAVPDQSQEPEGDDAVTLGPDDETLTVAVQENVPADLPGRAEAAAAREVPVGPAGPEGPEGDPEGAVGPAGPGTASPVTARPRTVLVWAQASVVTGREPVVVLSEIR
jgi:hypothetical protein